jgi:hypothetical protein
VNPFFLTCSSSPVTAGSCIGNSSGGYTKISACAAGAIPVPTSGVWAQTYSDNTCNNVLSIATQDAFSGTCSASLAASLFGAAPPGVSAAKTVCTTGNGVQMWAIAPARQISCSTLAPTFLPLLAPVLCLAHALLRLWGAAINFPALAPRWPRCL